MSSKELLEGLFDVEREAEGIVEEARAESRKLVEAVKASSRKSAEESRDRSLAEARRRESAAAAEIDASLAEALQSFRNTLSSTRLDEEAFRRACDRALEELYPR